jgi:uncharacterized YigZ family protein
MLSRSGVSSLPSTVAPIMHQTGGCDDLDFYRVAMDGEQVELRVKASRFFGQVYAAADEAAATERLREIRKRYQDASHHCWALRHGPPGAVIERCDDDGEPSGTAGPPLLHPLRASGLHDALVVVSRWFGGTKLGKGGLVQAYGACAQMAIAATDSRERWRESALEVDVAYDDLGTVEAVLAREATMIRGIERDFATTPRLSIRVRRSAATLLAADLVEATAGRVRPIVRAL